VRRLILLVAFLLMSFEGMAQDPVPLSAASPLQTIEGPFMGDYEGTGSLGGENQPLAAQVIVLGGGDYSIKLAPGLYDGSEVLGELKGKRDGGQVTVAGRAEGARWRGSIKEDVLRGTFGHGGTFDLKRVRRESPTLGAEPPPDAVVLFNGTSLAHFEHAGGDPQPTPCRWILLENGAMEVTQGGIISTEVFGDHKVHIEFRTPLKPEARGQDRGNSGVYLQGRYEVQVLDSYGLAGTDGECGGIYGVAPPRINMCFPPLQWQTYDIEFRAPRFSAEGNKEEHAKLTVWHNGVLIHEDVEVPNYTTAHVGGVMSEPGPLHLQDHGNPVWYRNIWVVPLQ